MGKRGPKPGGRPRGFMDPKRAREFQDKTSVKLESIAVGGPLDKVKLTASMAWDGTVHQIKHSHYAWKDGAWHWVLRTEPHYPGQPSPRKTF